MEQVKKWIVLGRVSGLFGVRGWIKVHSETSPRKRILSYPSWYLKRSGEWVKYELRDGHPQGKGIVAGLAGCNDRTQAEDLVGSDIGIPRTLLPPAAPGEYYWADLEGLRVVTLDGVELGRVERLFETGANDVMVVSGERERLIPFIDGAIDEVDLQQGRVTVDWDPEF